MKAFLSHSSEDKEFVQAIARELGRQFCVLVKSRSFCNFLQTDFPLYLSMSITPSVSRSSERRCSRSSSMSR